MKKLMKKLTNEETNEETESYEKQIVCHICKKEFSADKKNERKKKSEITVITQESLEEPLIISVIQDTKYR